MCQNISLGASVVKLHDASLDDEALKTRCSQDSLFSANFLRNTECLSGRMNAVLDGVSDQVGVYMYEDEDGLGIVRAGSAAAGIRKRHKEHIVGSKQACEQDAWSNFYSCYPDSEINGGKKGRIGNFHQLKQITGVRFRTEMKQNVVDMFQWGDDIIEFISSKNVSGAENLLEKKHRMVCYFFEKIFDLMIGLHQNLSRNPGFECFIGKWGGSNGRE